MSSTATDTERTIGRLLDRGANLQFARYVKRLAACAGLKLWTNAEVAIPVGMWTGRNKGLVTSYARKKHVIVDPAPVPKPDEDPPPQRPLSSTKGGGAASATNNPIRPPSVRSSSSELTLTYAIDIPEWQHTAFD